VWSRILGLGSVASAGGAIVPKKMFLVKTVSDGEVPQVVLLAILRGLDVRDRRDYLFQSIQYTHS
jgi:hypothetical protein